MKKGFFLLILGSIVALNPIARAADVREGLVSYWPFETVSGDNTTPDLSFANHFALNNLFATDLGPMMDDVVVLGTWRTRVVSFRFPGCK